MIKNGFYSYGSKALDGVDGDGNEVLVLWDGGILGGTSFFYFIVGAGLYLATHERAPY